MAVLELCIVIACVTVAVVAVWWLDRRVLRSGNRWLLWMSCVLTAAVAWPLCWMGAVCVLPELPTDDVVARGMIRWNALAIPCLGVMAVLLSLVTLAGAIVEFLASTQPRRWTIVVVPLLASGAVWAAVIAFAIGMGSMG